MFDVRLAHVFQPETADQVDDALKSCADIDWQLVELVSYLIVQKLNRPNHISMI